MELKRVKEYKSPEYPTAEESKNKILMMMVRSRKISLGVAVMCLLCNCSLAEERSFSGYFPVDYQYRKPTLLDSLGEAISLPLIMLWGGIITLILTLIFSIRIGIKYRKCEKEEDKKRLEKILISCICIGIAMSILFFIGRIFINFYIKFILP